MIIRGKIKAPKRFKKNLTKEVSEKTGINENSINIIITAFLNSIYENLSTGKQVDLKEFGSFIFVERKSRPVMHFKQNKTYIIPDRIVIRFLPGIALQKLTSTLKEFQKNNNAEEVKENE